MLRDGQPHLQRRTGVSPNLCMAGGVALNCVANGRVLPGDAFSRSSSSSPPLATPEAAVGAAALAHVPLQHDRATSPVVGNWTDA